MKVLNPNFMHVKAQKYHQQNLLDASKVHVLTTQKNGWLISLMIHLHVSSILILVMQLQLLEAACGVKKYSLQNAAR